MVLNQSGKPRKRSSRNCLRAAKGKPGACRSGFGGRKGWRTAANCLIGWRDDNWTTIEDSTKRERNGRDRVWRSLGGRSYRLPGLQGACSGQWIDRGVRCVMGTCRSSRTGLRKGRRRAREGVLYRNERRVGILEPSSVSRTSRNTADRRRFLWIRGSLKDFSTTSLDVSWALES